MIDKRGNTQNWTALEKVAKAKEIPVKVIMQWCNEYPLMIPIPIIHQNKSIGAHSPSPTVARNHVIDARWREEVLEDIQITLETVIRFVMRGNGSSGKGANKRLVWQITEFINLATAPWLNHGNALMVLGISGKRVAQNLYSFINWKRRNQCFVRLTFWVLKFHIPHQGKTMVRTKITVAPITNKNESRLRRFSREMNINGVIDLVKSKWGYSNLEHLARIVINFLMRDIISHTRLMTIKVQIKENPPPIKQVKILIFQVFLAPWWFSQKSNEIIQKLHAWWPWPRCHNGPDTTEDGTGTF